MILRRYLFGGGSFGKLIVLIGLLIGAPLAVLPFYPEELRYAPAFLAPMLFSALLGIVISIKTRVQSETITEWQSPMQRGSLIILSVWCYGFIMGAAPHILSGRLDIVRALFESVSAWTTVGLTLADVASTPNIFLFYRSLMQYCGGIGFILMMVMVVQGKQAMTLYNAEGHYDRLTPSLRQTARVIFSIYSGFLAVGVFLYKMFGMKLFDAICHSMAALSTAGVVTRAGSIGEYDSLPIEIISVALMLAGASNFAVLLLLTEGKIRKILRITEIRFMFGMIAVFVPLAAISLTTGAGMGAGKSIRHALFGVVAALSTTGYTIMNYADWPPFALGLLLMLMLIGGSSGSTAGGIKLSRLYLMLRIAYENIRKRLSPAFKTAAPSYYTFRGKTQIDSAIIMDTFGFVVCFAGVYIIGTLLLTLTSGCSLFEAMFEFASAFGTAGIPGRLMNSEANTATLIVKMAGMILGRLEIYVVFIGIYSSAHLLRRKLRRKSS